jgi:G3E family GTPase
LPTDVPVTVVGGFLGAGKTTLVNRLIPAIDRRVGVLVNDFGELAIDQRLIVAADDDVVALSNGCICCAMRDGVMSTVYQVLEREDPPEHLVVEASGVSDPRSLADLFIDAERVGTVRLDALIGVADAGRFDPTDRLARAQVQAADLVVLNKIDTVDDARREEVEAAVREAAPHARVVPASYGNVPVPILLGARADQMRKLGHVHGIDASRFESWSYVRDDPVSFRHILPVLKDLPRTIYRVKGTLNLEERPNKDIVVQVVGRRLWVKTLGDTDAPRTALAFIAERGTVDREALDARLSGSGHP